MPDHASVLPMKIAAASKKTCFRSGVVGKLRASRGAMPSCCWTASWTAARRSWPIEHWRSFGEPHWFHDLHVHLAAALPNAPFVEYFPDDQVLNFRRLVDRQLEFRGGDLVVPTDPGLGFGFDEAAIAVTAIVPWADNS